MYLIKSHRLTYIQVLQVVMNLIFSYCGSDFAPLVPILQSIHSGGIGLSVKTKAKKLLSIRVFPHAFLPVCHLCLSKGYTFYDLSFLADGHALAFLIHLVMYSCDSQTSKQLDFRHEFSILCEINL